MSDIDIAAVERRLSAALDRIVAAADTGAGSESIVAMSEARDAAVAAEAKARGEADMLAEKIARLEEALETEAQATEQLRERNHTLKQAKDEAQSKANALEQELREARAAQQTDRAELDEVLGALEPLVKE